MKPMSLATALGALMLITSSCTDSAASSVAGEYSIDIEPTVAGMVAKLPENSAMTAEAKTKMSDLLKTSLGSATLTLNSDLTFAAAGEKKSATGELETSTRKGTYVVEDGKITLNITHEDGKESKSTETGTIVEGKMTIATGSADKTVDVHFVKAKS